MDRDDRISGTREESLISVLPEEPLRARITEHVLALFFFHGVEDADVVQGEGHRGYDSERVKDDEDRDHGVPAAEEVLRLYVIGR